MSIDTSTDVTVEPAPSLAFPSLFIIQATQSDEEPRHAVYPLETAPIEAFNAWLDDILATEDHGGDALFHFIVSKHRATWDDMARLWVLTDLRIRSIDVTKYTYVTRAVAEQAVKARRMQ